MNFILMLERMKIEKAERMKIEKAEKLVATLHDKK